MSTQSLMNHMGRCLLLTGTIPTPDEILRRYDAVTWEEVAELARTIFDPARLSLSAVGQVRDEEGYRSLLK